MGGKGSGGHNRKPTAKKKLEGNRGHRKLNDKEPKAEPGEPQIPAYLSTRAKVYWRRLVPMLLEMKVLTKADGYSLGLLCNALAEVELAELAIARYGLIAITPDSDGVVILKANPAVRIKANAWRQATSALSKFGLDPASRSGLTPASLLNPAKDAIERLMEDGNNDEVIN
jgi:P27 family predicted phage terminase small subunit